MTESIEYKLVRKLEAAEIRRYPSILLATVFGESDNEAFTRLFNFITGNNRSRKKIPMTAPVVSSEKEGEKMQMTVPVLSGSNSFSFVMPPSFSADDLPIPLDDHVKIEKVGARLVAALMFRGRASRRSTVEHLGELNGILKRNGIKAKGEPFLMRYNSPMTPGFMRRNEVAIEIDG